MKQTRVSPPLSATVSAKDIRIISRVTKTLLARGMPLNIIDTILDAYYTNERRGLPTIHYYFREGCGSGSISATISINNEEVVIKFRRNWMGGGDDNRKVYEYSGKYGHVDGTNGTNYGIIKIDRVTIDGEDNPVELYFDLYQFDYTLCTDWGQDIPNDLYAGGGCHSNESNNAHLILNRNCLLNGDYPDEKRCIQQIDGRKFCRTNKQYHM